ncbi:MAG: C10 family peptidase [Paludibacteraceae bacterium]|nr:C10 family peptidase [Paludibacteraceae bacterium]MBR6445559.1 C10 family peptidase [Prevotella sp.]
MRKILLLMLSLVMVTMVKAEGVTPQQALEQARNFIQKRENNGSRPRRAPGTAASRLVMAKQVNGLYVFKMAKNEGFVIVSNDDRTEPILGYSDSGNFDPDNMPDNMRAWLQGYADQIAWLNEHPEFENVIAKAPTKNSIVPLMISKWNQDEPFNNLCPTDPSTNKICVTGCVATAMAQVMYYHRWPEKTIAKIPSYTTDTRSIAVGSIANGTVFDWDNMLPVYEDGATADQQTAVATLMKVCGASVEMNYTSSGSGAYLDPYALVNYFDYSKTTREVDRKNYTFADWNNLIYAELAEGRPVLYGGDSSGGGHQFVVDGYDGDELFHVNWGWGGHQDGYFLLSVLNPGSTAGIGASSTSDGYSYGQTAIIGVKPNDGDVFLDKIKLTSSIVSVSGNNIYSSYRNQTNDTYTFDFGIGFIKDDGDITLIGSSRNTTLGEGWGYDSYPFSVSGLPDGVYKIVPISKENGTDTWYSNVSSSKEYVEAVVGNGAVTLTLHKPVLDLDAISFDYRGSKKAGSEQLVDVTIRNNGDEYYGLLYLFASKNTTKGSYQSKTGVTIVENKSLTTQFSFTPATEGNYNIWITTDASGNNVVGTSNVEIGAASTETPNLSHVSTVLDKMQDGNILGHSFTGTASFKNNGTETFIGSIRVRFLVNTTGNAYTTVSDAYVPVEIASNQTESINYEFSGLTVGKRYWIIYYYPSGSELHRFTTFLCVAVPEVYQADGTCELQDVKSSYVLDEKVSALNLSGISGVTSVTGGNENTLFIFGADDNVPSSLNGRNVVKGGNAENITLQDGTDFYSPVTFTAENISYTRTFDTGMTRDYKNWTTIVLPFDVSSVTVDLTSQGSAYTAYSAYPIDWFHNATETKKNFWVMEFGSEEGGIVNFSHAAEIKAARPLLIAVPGIEWGSKNDLTGLPITFHGTNATVSGDFRAATSGDNYKMKGIVAQKTLNDIFVLNTDGNAFTRQNSATVDAFRAYFEPTSTAATASMLMMSFGGNQGETTGLGGIFTDNRETNFDNGWYMLDGRKLNGEPTQKGIYIYNGKKVKK